MSRWQTTKSTQEKWRKSVNYGQPPTNYSRLSLLIQDQTDDGAVKNCGNFWVIISETHILLNETESAAYDSFDKASVVLQMILCVTTEKDSLFLATATINLVSCKWQLKLI